MSHRKESSPPKKPHLQTPELLRDGLRTLVVQAHGIDHHLIAGDAPTPAMAAMGNDGETMMNG